jgi:ankyrin repeat protein
MVAGLMLYDMSQMKMEVLILCSANEGGIRIPSSLCKYYMVNYRINEKGIKELREGVGLGYVLGVERKFSDYEMTKIFIANGLGVDSVNHYGDVDVTPLQSAVLSNDVRGVKFLIGYRVDVRIKNERYGMTALEMAKKFHKEESKLQNRSEIIQILSDADKP